MTVAVREMLDFHHLEEEAGCGEKEGASSETVGQTGALAEKLGKGRDSLPVAHGTAEVIVGESTGPGVVVVEEEKSLDRLDQVNMALG